MPTVTNGSVEYSRNVKVADYENKALKVCWSFIVDDGEDRVAVTDKLTFELTEMVHAKLGLIKATPAQEPAQPPKQTRARKAAPEATASGSADPAPETPTASPETPAEITDKDIKDLIHLKRTQHGVTGKQIRDLVLTFAETIREIAPEKRAEFKTKLEALSKAGND
jgi:hypothetical protein